MGLNKKCQIKLVFRLQYKCSVTLKAFLMCTSVYLGIFKKLYQDQTILSILQNVNLLQT